MNLDEVFGKQELTIKLAHSGLKSENGLIGGHSKIDYAVVQSGVLINNWHLLLSLLS